MDRPATLSGAQGTSTIPNSGTYAGYICPSVDSGNKRPGKTGIYYNGCYTTATGATADATCGSRLHVQRANRLKQNLSLLARRRHGGDGGGGARPQHLDRLCQRSRPGLRHQERCTGIRATPARPRSSTRSNGSDCLSATVIPMSNDWQTLKDKITAMTPAGNTNQAVGMAWGWQSLSTTNGPIAAPAKANNYILQGLHRPAVGRFEHPEPLEHVPVQHRRPPGETMRRTSTLITLIKPIPSRCSRSRSTSTTGTRYRRC